MNKRFDTTQITPKEALYLVFAGAVSMAILLLVFLASASFLARSSGLVVIPAVLLTIGLVNYSQRTRYFLWVSGLFLTIAGGYFMAVSNALYSDLPFWTGVTFLVVGLIFNLFRLSLRNRVKSGSAQLSPRTRSAEFLR